MKYLEVTFTTHPCNETVNDVVSALAGEIGFESFVECEGGIQAYIQQTLFDEEALKEMVVNFPLPDTRIEYTIKEAEDKNWNEEWEKNFFQPIVIGDRCCIHSTFHKDTPKTEYEILINPQMAFGTGHHETTSSIISEHIEFAGVHSGDATIQFPPQKLYVETVRRIKRISREIAKELNISGPFNIQFLAKENDIKVIECNLRASRSFPFVSKVLKINFIELATKVMLGLPVEKPSKNLFELDYVGIKASQFSFNRLQKADPVLGVDMASTGEVGCIGSDTSSAVLQAMLSVGHRIPKKNILLSTGTPKQKADMIDAARLLANKGYKIYATGGTHKYLTENNIESTLVYWPSESGKPQALDMLHKKELDMVVNVPKNLTAGELDNGYKIRRAAIDLNIPLITNARLASSFINAFCTMSIDDIAIKSWEEYK